MRKLFLICAFCLPAAAATVDRVAAVVERQVIAVSEVTQMVETRFFPRTANFIFNTGVFSWLDNGEFPIFTSRPAPVDTQVLVSKDQVKMLRLGYLYILPGILVLMGAVLLLRRKRK